MSRRNEDKSFDLDHIKKYQDQIKGIFKLMKDQDEKVQEKLKSLSIKLQANQQTANIKCCVFDMDLLNKLEQSLKQDIQVFKTERENNSRKEFSNIQEQINELSYQI